MKVPEAFPAAVGSNHTWNVPDFPAGSVIGMVRPVIANWLLDRLAWAMLTETVPVFETVAVCEAFLPTVVVPKLKLAGETCIEPSDCDEFVPPALTSPAQPASTNIGATAKTPMSRRRQKEFPNWRANHCGPPDERMCEIFLK